MMNRILLVEWMKLRTYPMFWIALALYAAFIPMLANLLLSADFSQQGEEIDLLAFIAPAAVNMWEFMLYAGSYGVYVLILFVLSFTNRDINSGLWRQYLIEGVSRKDLFLGKGFVMLALSALALLLLIGTGAIIITYQGYDEVISSLWQRTGFVLGYALYFLGFMVMAFAVNLVLKSTTLSFLVVFFWGLFMEALVRWADPTRISELLPVFNLNRIIPNPVAALLSNEVVLSPDPVHVALSVLWVVIFSAIAFVIIQSRDF